MGFSRQEYWSGLPCPPQGDLPDTGTGPRSPTFRQILYCHSHQERPTRRKQVLNWGGGGRVIPGTAICLSDSREKKDWEMDAGSSGGRLSTAEVPLYSCLVWAAGFLVSFGAEQSAQQGVHWFGSGGRGLLCWVEGTLLTLSNFIFRITTPCRCCRYQQCLPTRNLPQVTLLGDDAAREHTQDWPVPKILPGISLAVQRLRLCALNAGARVPSQVRELDPTCHSWDPAQPNK